jgi:rifampicin phosphotransferase
LRTLHAGALGDGPLAVRSSAAAEDLAGASYAGLYETFLDVDPAQLADAVWDCWESATSQRVTTYQQHHQHASGGSGEDSGRPAMAVLVQRMVHPDASGVAFTANPVTGARDQVVITAVRGLGERLVAGQDPGDQWVIRHGQASCTRTAEQAITADQALEVATLARRVEQHVGIPQDLEWAIGDDRLWLLQARPMTALPEPVDWTPPAPGYWMRNFRLGEWLPEPMTPLFASWLLQRLEDGYLQATRQHTGAALVFPHAAINGWYYTATPRLSPRTLLSVLLAGRGRLVGFLRYAVLGPGRDPVTADRRLLHRLAEEWRQELLLRYQHAVQEGQQQVQTADPAELVGLVDAVGVLAGEYLWSLSVVGGSAWKMEGALAGFVRQHLAAAVGGGVQQLLVGLPGIQPDLPPYAVQSLDWAHPTAGELGWQPPRPSDRHRELAAQREQLTARCAAALADRPALQARFLALVEVAQRYAVLREQQARQLTLAWPLLRGCTLHLGDHLRTKGVIDQPKDVFFLTRAELDHPSPLREVVGQRRAVWERQRRLPAPLPSATHPAWSSGNCWPPWTPSAPAVPWPRAPSSASRPAPAGPPARSALWPTPATSTASNPARSWSPGPPRPPGRRCSPAPPRSSPTAAPWPPMPPWSPASTASPPWSPPATLPPDSATGSESPSTAAPAPSTHTPDRAPARAPQPTALRGDIADGVARWPTGAPGSRPRGGLGSWPSWRLRN